MKKIHKITFISIFAAFAMVLSYVEMMLPPIWSAVPGIKVGLPNVIIIFVLYKLSFKYAAFISLLRVFAVALLFGNVLTLSYSIAGAVISLSLMWLLKKTSLFSMVGVSIAGGVSHNLGQIIVAMIIMQTKEIGYYMAVLAVSGVLAGIVIGLIGAMLLKYTKKIKIK